MSKLYLLVSVILFSACSHAKLTQIPLEPKLKLVRGWSFIEPETEILGMESGAAQTNYSAPVIDGERLIYGSDRFGLMALNKFNGHKIWQKKIKNGVSSTPLIFQSKIFFGGEDGVFYCLDRNGAELWRSDVSMMPTRGLPIVVDQKVIFAAIDESVHALDITTGKPIWAYKRPIFTNTSIHGGGNPSYIDGKIWIGFSDGSIIALNPQDGGVQLEHQYRDNLKFMDIDARPVPWKDGILISTYDGKLRYLHHDASVIWEFPMGGARAPVISSNGENIYLPGSDGNIYSIAGLTNKEIWRSAVPHGVPTGVALLEDKNAIASVSSVERVSVIDMSSGKELAHFDLGHGSGSFSSIVADPETKSFYVLSSFGRVHQFHFER